MRGAHELERRLEVWSRRHHLIEPGLLAPGERVVLAVSGGSDSMALLHLFAGLAPAWGLQLAVAHFDHGWRGDSAADADWVEAQVRRLQLPFLTAKAAPVSGAGNREQMARRARYRFLSRSAIQFGGRHAATVATGHTADDQAETVLLRLLRGTGTAGLAGILPTRAQTASPPGGFIVRPLLFARHGELQAWLSGRGLHWREDATNLDVRYRRNWIRRDLLPRMAAANPAIVERLGTLAEVARQEEAFWSGYVDDLWASCWEPHGDGWRAPRARLAAMEPAVQRRLLREAVRRAQGDLLGVEFAALEDIVVWAGAVPTRPRFRPLGRCRCLVSAGWVEIRLTPGGVRSPARTPGGGVFEL